MEAINNDNYEEAAAAN